MDTTVDEFVKFDNCFDTCEPVVNTLSVNWQQELREECIQSAINLDIEPENSDLEEDTNDMMGIDSEPAVSSGKVFEILDKLQVFLEKNDAEYDMLPSVA